MDTDELGSLLDSIGTIRHACDLDLLLFFNRHPRALLTVEQLALRLGYQHHRVAKSIEALTAAGLLTQFTTPSRAARLYVLDPSGVQGGLLSSLARIAVTRAGRQDAIRRLRPRPDPAPGVHFESPAFPPEPRVA